MSYDEELAQVMRNALARLDGVTEKRMFGGLCFPRNGNMLCGVHRRGGMARAGKENEESALQIEGATGLQVGTAFAFCDDSGFRDDIRQRVVKECLDGQPDIVTDPLASPTGFPFKVLQVEGSMSDDMQCQQRQRVCEFGFLAISV